MSVLPLFEYPHPVLREIAEPVKVVDSDIRRLLDDMLETMYADKGVGLAAPQVGVLKRLIVIDAHQHDDKEDVVQKGKPMFLINPEIIYRSPETIMFCEGCLSIPGQNADVKRFQTIRVRYLDDEGQAQEIEVSDYEAVVIQHEIDHLDGILYIDHLSRLKRDMLLKKLKKYWESHKKQRE